MRVAPRSVILVAAVSATISSSVVAVDRTGQVQVISPTVLKRTERVSTLSPFFGCASSETGIKPLLGDVAPHVQFRPVADWENADVLAPMDPRVVEIPKFRTLVLGVPLAEFIAKREYPFLRPGFFFVPPRAADAGAKTKFLYGIKQGDRLMRVAAFIRSFQDDSSARHGVLHGAHYETLTQLHRSPVAKFDHFGKIVDGVDV